MKEIKNTTIYSSENIKKFLEIYYFEKIKKPRIILNILIAIIIISFFVNEENSILDIISFVFAVFGLLELNTSMLPRFNYYKLTKKKDSIINNKITYVFKKNNFKLNQDEYIDYNKLFKVIETETNYYLYINKDRVLIVDKINFSDEDNKELSNRLKEQVSTYILKI